MANQVSVAVENNFTKGLLTEFTGLNFPENACTDAENTYFDIIGDVSRRLGIDFEDSSVPLITPAANVAYSNFSWTNAGGTGGVKIQVVQVGSTLYFYETSGASQTTSPSSKRLASTVNISQFLADQANTTFQTEECQYAEGNGYLFVYHPNCDPFYCTYTAGSIVATAITVKIRDFNGVLDVNSPQATTRPTLLYNEHKYNLVNQGWSSGAPWTTTSSTVQPIDLGVRTFTVDPGLGINLGDIFLATVLSLSQDPSQYYYGSVPIPGIALSGTVVGYVGNQLTLNCTDDNPGAYPNNPYTGRPPYGATWSISTPNFGFIDTWNAAIGNYPSNADIWWSFKDTSGNFNPGNTQSNVNLNSGVAPRGHFILNAFQQTRSTTTGISLLTDCITKARPRTGTWFQGRVWYAGVDDATNLFGNAKPYTWTETIYFSQVIVDNDQIGQCYQTNDPTAQDNAQLLPTDGGTIQIQGCGSIYKLFPIQNGLLVFAANGVWFITGSQGIGFAANDYTVTKISQIQSISGSSFVNVQGLPYFWNEEGIYAVQPQQQGGLAVNSISVGTIGQYYNKIPSSSKRYARADYHPIDYVIQWTFRKDPETGISDRYDFDSILNYNIYNKAFYPYTVDGPAKIRGIFYLPSLSKPDSLEGMFKYIASVPTQYLSFADEHDDRYLDWYSVDNEGTDYDSFFVTGYKLRGQGIKKFQPLYIQMYSRVNGEAGGYKFQGIWDYANDRNSNRWSSLQQVTNALTRHDVITRRHKIRGHGYALQFKVSSSSGLPFDIIGWAAIDLTNTNA